MYCHHCGREISDEAAFCPGCGKRQGGADSPASGKASATAQGTSATPPGESASTHGNQKGVPASSSPAAAQDIPVGQAPSASSTPAPDSRPSDQGAHGMDASQAASDGSASPGTPDGEKKSDSSPLRCCGCIVLLVLLLAGGYVWHEGLLDSWFAPSGIPLEELEREGRAPVTFSTPQRGMTPPGLPPQFLLRMTNHSDLHISIIEVTQQFRNGDGQWFSHDTAFTPSYARRFDPASEYEIQMPAPRGDAIAARVILKGIVYDFQPDPKRMPHTTIQRRWNNPAYERDVKRTAQN